MALQMPFTANDGTYCPEGYVRIAILRSVSTQTYIHVYWHRDAASRAAGELPMRVSDHDAGTEELDYPGGPYAAVYAYLKTLPEFAGAIDV